VPEVRQEGFRGFAIRESEVSVLRLQDTGEDEATRSQAFEGSLNLPGTRTLYEALLPEAGKAERVSLDGGRLHVTIEATDTAALQARVNSWLRMYKALEGVEKGVK
jgi:tRNA threonylcarbamoyladenosine modification (KEOPS) complex  Pcc1 subunit